MSLTDYWGNVINVGDILWVPTKVKAFTQLNTISTEFTNADGTKATLTVVPGQTGQSVDPLEGDRPPH
jgi:hypothetical protein